MIVITPYEAEGLVMLARNPQGIEHIVETFNFDAQRIGDILIGRAIPIMDKLAVHHQCAKDLIRIFRKSGVCVQ